MERRNFFKIAGMATIAGLIDTQLGWAQKAVEHGQKYIHDKEGDKLLIKGAQIITMDPGNTILLGDILIQNGKIKKIAKHIQEENCRIIEADGKFVLPGFINTHNHMWEGITRGFSAAMTMPEYMDWLIKKIGPALTPEDVYLGTLIAALEQINAGVTTALDWAHATNSPEFADAGVDALQESGIRAVYAYGLLGPSFRYPYSDGAGGKKYLEDLYRMKKERLTSGDALVTLGIATTVPENKDVNKLKTEARVAEELDALLTMHIGPLPSRDSGAMRISDLHAMGIMNRRFNFVHGNDITEKEFLYIKEAGASLSVTPEVEWQMGHGVPPLLQSSQADIILALGTDVSASVSNDMFAQMRSAYSTTLGMAHQKAAGENKVYAHKLPVALKDILAWGTVGGARALGLDHITGSLEVGKQADLILIENKAMNMIPAIDPIAAIVLQAHPGNVDTVIIGGRILKEKGKLLHHQISSDMMLSKIQSASERLYTKSMKS
ncbi:amidohydrolase family protein [Chryseobacterium jejuense]|uniref:Atrazine chlorohydrolase n=1 Tax=Chryseobacterium jejuense TaxID=445960 RepID=A0A2X2VJE1_CHRJE|nr:amidohydrolase family protein [Chryseobacterium jejuense]SDI37581.1 Cytosine/adenosine deaminase [Chryseobacterium jejuense]SQB26877.1 Atrazine chlorohydrolase [Chryseobacterium jejuense]